ncbi:MAG: PAS domain S-box protein, partial [Thiohalospira sp.]
MRGEGENPEFHAHLNTLPTESIRVLLVEDDPGDAERIASGLRSVDRPAFEVSRVEHRAFTPEAVEHEGVDVVLLGLPQPGPEGLGSVEGACRSMESIPLLVLSDQDEDDFALAALRAGAQDHLSKGETDVRILVRAIRYALSRTIERRQLEPVTEREREETNVPVPANSERHALKGEQAVARRFREMLLASLGEGVFGIDAEGRFTFLNPVACRLFGFPDEAWALGQNSHATSHHSHPDGTPYPERDCPINAVLQTGEPVEAWEDTYWSRDGRSFPVQVYAAPIREESGEIVGAVVSFQDITQRKAAERERDRLLSILEATPDFVSMAKPDGAITYINRGGLTIMGLDPERNGLEKPLPDEVVNDAAGYLAHPEWATRRVNEEGLPAAVAHGVWQGETAYFDQAGREIPASQVILAHRDEHGELERFSTIMRDMSEQRQLERQLRTEKEFSDAILRNLPGVFYMIDAAGRFRHWNERLETVTGYTGEALAEVSPLELYPESEQALVETGMREVFDEGATELETHLCHRDGGCRAYYLTGYRVELGDEVYLLGVGLDISDRVRAEQALSENEARYRDLVENQPQFIERYLPDTTITFANHALARVFGTTPEALLGQRWLSMVPEEEQERIRAHLESFTPESPTGDAENSLVLENGEERWTQWTNTAFFDEARTLTHFQSVGMDITDRKQAEAELAIGDVHAHRLEVGQGPRLIKEGGIGP